MREGNIEYFIPGAEINATEDFMHELALRKENEDSLKNKYTTYLKSVQPEEEKMAEVVPFPTSEVSQEQPEIPAVSIVPEMNTEQEVTVASKVVDTPTLEPISIIESVVPDIPVENVVSEIPQVNAEEAKIVDFPNVSNTVVEEQPQANRVDTPVINEMPKEELANTVIDFPTMEEQVPTTENVKVEENQSTVTNSYINTANELISQMRELTNKYLQTMEEMATKMHGNFKEAQEYRKLSMQTYDNAQQILSQTKNQEETNDLTRVA